MPLTAVASYELYQALHLLAAGINSINTWFATRALVPAALLHDSYSFSERIGMGIRFSRVTEQQKWTTQPDSLGEGVLPMNGFCSYTFTEIADMGNSDVKEKYSPAITGDL